VGRNKQAADGREDQVHAFVQIFEQAFDLAKFRSARGDGA
jgi:hypothetical protein